MRCEACEALATVETSGLSGERRSEPAAARRIRRHAGNVVAPVCALRTKVRLGCIGLHKLLSRQGALLTGIPYFLTPLRALGCRKAPQFTVFATLQGAFSPQLLPRVKLLLALRLQICLRLCARPSCPGLCVRRELTLAFCTQLLSLNVSVLLNVPLLLLNIAVNHRRRLVALRGGKS
jgi:hypothetical protein